MTKQIAAQKLRDAQNSIFDVEKDLPLDTEIRKSFYRVRISLNDLILMLPNINELEDKQINS